MLRGSKPIGTVAYLGGVAAVAEPFCWSLAQMIQFTNEYVAGPGEYVHLDRATISFHAHARNTLADQMMGDWLLMLDTDHVFEPDLLARMLDRFNGEGLDVLTGLYQMKVPPFAPVIYQWNGTGYDLIGRWNEDVSLFRIDSAGGGCLLVRRSVFNRIREELGESPFDIEHPFGEDHSFFNRLRRLEIKAWCDSRIECRHLQLRPLSLADFDRSRLQFSSERTVEGIR